MGVSFFALGWGCFRPISGLLVFASLFAWSLLICIRHQCGWRWGFTLSCVLLSLFVLMLTEFLSIIGLLNAPLLGACWMAFLIVPLVAVGKTPSGFFRNEVNRALLKLKAVPAWYLAGIILMVGVIAVMAIASPPCNYDVQCYHLPRQIYWMMQGSVRHFDATYAYQNVHPVLTEFLGLNLLMISGGDHWHNLVQWVFLVASCGVVTLLAGALGGGAREQSLAVLFVLTVPAIFFEGSNAKNDIVESFFILSAFLIGIRLWKGEWQASIPLLLLASLSAGLAMAAKGTAIAYLPGVAILVASATLRQGRGRVLLACLPIAFCAALLPIAPNSLRNLQTYHSLGGEALALVNASHTPGAVFGVAVKNVANQFAFGSAEWIAGVESVCRSLLHTLGLPPDDPLTNIPAAQLGGTKLRFFYIVGCEDVVPAPIQTLLLLFIPFLPLFRRFRTSTAALPMVLVAIFSFVMFCGVFRWQPWGGRLLIPEFFMTAPLVGFAEGILLIRSIPPLIAALQMLFLWPHISHVGARHLLGWWSVFRLPQEEQMSIAFPGRREEIQSVSGIVRDSGARSVKIDGKDTPVYGLLRELRLKFPALILVSGHVTTPSREDVIVEAMGSSQSGAGAMPEGYVLSHEGTYYRVYRKNPESR